MHRALEVEVVEHGPADQTDQQRVPPCRKGAWQSRSPPRRDSPPQAADSLHRYNRDTVRFHTFPLQASGLRNVCPTAQGASAHVPAAHNQRGRPGTSMPCTHALILKPPRAPDTEATGGMTMRPRPPHFGTWRRPHVTLRPATSTLSRCHQS